MKSKIFILFVFVLQLSLAQTTDIKGKWKSVNKEFNYEVIYKIKIVDSKYEGVALFFKSPEGEHKFSEDDNVNILRDFEFMNTGLLTGKYLDVENDIEYEAEIKIIDKNNLELRIKNSEGDLKEKFSRIID